MIVPLESIAYAAGFAVAIGRGLASEQSATAHSRPGRGGALPPGPCHRGGIELTAPVRYTGQPLGETGAGPPPLHLDTIWRRKNVLGIMGL